MASASDKKKWDDLHAALAKAEAAELAYEIELGAKYGHNFSSSWLSKGQKTKLEALRAKKDKIGAKIYELVERISPRDWSSGVPSWWVRSKLTWEDAIRPKNEPLSVVVPGAYGSRDGTVTERESSMATRKMRSRTQPSLPGFPDMPGKLEIKIPNMPMWEQIGGDTDLSAHGGIIATADGDHIELLEIQPVREHVGDEEAAEVGFPFWTKEAWFDLDDLDPKNKDVQSALDSAGFDSDDQKVWFEEEATPEQRAIAIAEALLQHGSGEEGPAGWSDDLPNHNVKWQSGKVAPLNEYLADEDDEFRNDVLGYDDIRSKLEEIVDQMADESSAQTWSTVGDQAADDAEEAGYDPDSLVGVAEFGDAVAVNGDIEGERTLAGVEANLEKEGYEQTDGGGEVPAEEAMVSPEHAIRAVAKDMGLDEDVVEKAAEGIDWWPKKPNEEIASSTSGWASIWGKKDPNAHVDDGDYVVQGMWSDGRTTGEDFGMDDEKAAVSAAKKLLRDPTFEGDSVRVITRDGELVWSSDPNEGEPVEERRPGSRRRR